MGKIVTFYSYKGGTGRSMALANTAWILASNGLHVLAVDWDLESPGLHRYFHPFLMDGGRRTLPGVIDMVWDFSVATMESGPVDAGWLEDRSQVMRYAVSLEQDYIGGGTLDFVSAGQDRPDYALKVSRLDWDVLYEKQGGGAFFEKLGENMRKHYDYVLIDSRTGWSDTAGICTVALPDTLVNCFTLSTQSIDGAAAVARSVRRQAPRSVRVLPVPMRIEDAEKSKLEAGRDYARSCFTELLSDRDQAEQERYWGEVEVPYKTYYAYEEILATIGDRPHQENTLLAAFERLAGVLTDGQIHELVPLPEAERRRRLAEYERTKPPAPSDVFLSHTEQDRMWAEWVAYQLEAAGYRVVRQQADFHPGADLRWEISRAINAAAYTVIILSPDYVETPYARGTWDAAVARDPVGSQGMLLPVKVVEFRAPGVYDSRVPIELFDLTAEQAREELLAALREPGAGVSVPDGPGREDTEAPRFPGDQPLVFRVPPRNRNFVGRDAALLELRSRLAKSSTAAVVPQALHGLGGVGKTQIAQEFAHRFAPDYDLVWWIPAEQVSEARAALTQMAPHLGIEPSDDASETLRMVLDALRRGEPIRRWLLIFDNADDTEDIQALLPQGPGHVLVTSRNQDWSMVADTIEVDAFTREESIALLQRRGRNIDTSEADLLAEHLGDLPLAIEQAAVWQAETGMPIEEYLRLFEEQRENLLSATTTPSYPESVAATWGIAFDRLERRSPAAMQLLQVCAFFGPDPIPFGLLKVGRFAPSLPSPLNEVISNTILRRRAVREIARYALARVDPGRDTLVVHRLVQVVLRDRLTEEQWRAFRAGAHELLAAANPGTPDNDQYWNRHAELSPHIVPSGAIDGIRADTRKVVMDQVRYRYRRGDIEGSRELAELARARWLDTLGPDHEQTLTVSMHLADALWWLGRMAEAAEIRKDTLDRLRDTFGENHEITLMVANGVGADLRAAGQFEGALVHDQDCFARHRQVFGDDDPNTLRSAGNLAVDLRLAGEFVRARDLDQDTLERRRRMLRELDSEILLAIAGVARALIGLGQYPEARTVLGGSLPEFQGGLGVRHGEVLRAARTFAVAVRKAGDHEEARRLTDDNLAAHRARFGDRHLDTLAVMASAAHDSRAIGDLVGAEELSEQTLAGYRETVGDDHPFPYIALTNLAIVLRANGDVAAARALNEDAVTGLRRRLGGDHPFTLCALGNLASDHAAAGEHETAVRLSEAVVTASRAVRGDNHPYTLGSLLNLAADRSASGDISGGERLRVDALERLRHVLGADHPSVEASTEGQRAEFEIDPPEL